METDLLDRSPAVLEIPGYVLDLTHDIVLGRSMNELSIKTAFHDTLFQLTEADWYLSQDTGDITFTSPNGMMTTAPAQIIGTYNNDDGTWLWSWGNSSIDSSMAEHAALVQEYGKIRGLSELTARKFSTTEEKCWEYAALACLIGDFQCAYLGRAGATSVFITYGEVMMTNAQP